MKEFLTGMCVGMAVTIISVTIYYSNKDFIVGDCIRKLDSTINEKVAMVTSKGIVVTSTKLLYDNVLLSVYDQNELKKYTLIECSK